jgi:NAD(P)-dependent dehydrogenase (short-subunit alcohol dehydrogenase family)
MNRLSGIAVITGGASGIGAACCHVFRDWGAGVVVFDRDIARARSVAEQVGGSAVAGDVGDAEAIDRVAADIEAAHGPVAMLVNSAGVIQRPLRPEALSMADWDDVVRIDQRGTYRLRAAHGATPARRNREYRQYRRDAVDAVACLLASQGGRHLDYREPRCRMGPDRRPRECGLAGLHPNAGAAGRD